MSHTVQTTLQELPRVDNIEAALNEQSRSDVLFCVSGFNTDCHVYELIYHARSYATIATAIKG